MHSLFSSSYATFSTPSHFSWAYRATRSYASLSFSRRSWLRTSLLLIPVRFLKPYNYNLGLTFKLATDLKAITQGENPLSPRAFTIASYALCGFANLGSLGIQIGVLGALAPSRQKVIARIAMSAMICGFISTLQTAGIAYVFFYLEFVLAHS